MTDPSCATRDDAYFSFLRSQTQNSLAFAGRGSVAEVAYH